MAVIDTILTDANKAMAIVATLQAMTPETEAIVTGGLALISGIKRMIQSVAKNPDGTPITDAQFAAHMAAAGNPNAAIIIAAALAQAEDAKLASAPPA